MIVFADTSYWLAHVDARDALHSRAIGLWRQFRVTRVVTSQMVLAEVLASVAARGQVRIAGVALIDEICSHVGVDVVPQTSELFHRALALYRARNDKAWSLTDCASFQIMRELGIEDALAYDHHFRQAGFNALLRSD